jgi:hypothetical protein
VRNAACQSPDALQARRLLHLLLQALNLRDVYSQAQHAFDGAVRAAQRLQAGLIQPFAPLKLVLNRLALQGAPMILQRRKVGVGGLEVVHQRSAAQLVLMQSKRAESCAQRGSEAQVAVYCPGDGRQLAQNQAQSLL